MKAIFVINNNLIDTDLVLSVIGNESELALILEYQTSDNIVTVYLDNISDYNYYLNYLQTVIAQRQHPIQPSPEPVPIPDKPDAKITLAVLQLILQDYAKLTDVVFHNGDTIPPTTDFDYLIPNNGSHIVFPALPSTSYTHQPAGFTSGLIICGNVGGLGYCICFPTGDTQLFFRTYNNGVWSSWGSIPSATIIERLQLIVPESASANNPLVTQNELAQVYTKPESGIPLDDLSQSLQESIHKADLALQIDDLKTIQGQEITGSGDITIINDNSTSGTETWSSDKIVEEMSKASGTVCSVNHIEPDDDKNVQIDEELTKEAYDELVESGDLDANKYYFVKDVPALSFTDNVPIGSYCDLNTSVCPQGYLPCDGRLLSIADYPELYTVIGDEYTDRTITTDPGKFRLPKFTNNLVKDTWYRTLDNSKPWYRWMELVVSSATQQVTISPDRDVYDIRDVKTQVWTTAWQYNSGMGPGWDSSSWKAGMMWNYASVKRAVTLNFGTSLVGSTIRLHVWLSVPTVGLMESAIYDPTLNGIRYIKYTNHSFSLKKEIQVNDSIIAPTSVWSSSKTENEIIKSINDRMLGDFVIRVYEATFPTVTGNSYVVLDGISRIEQFPVILGASSLYKNNMYYSNQLDDHILMYGEDRNIRLRFANITQAQIDSWGGTTVKVYVAYKPI